ncbi:MAG TPA: UDP-N-acetylmuramate--L-alanine ligase, partial [Chthoniobacterales bacterium]|nr:UDP-N-acetylmuramate--L-alanine ligase [Chthoniobacterales bacterium]
GHEVSGSDRVSSLETRRLEAAGLKFHLPQTAETVRGAELVIYSSAIRPGNPAYDEALRLDLWMVRRAEALAAILAIRDGIVIAGMHGKTTTSAMAAHVLRVGGLQPSHYVGAEIPILGTNAHWDPHGRHFVAEGDESDGTLRFYQAKHAVILNVELEHLDYYPDLAAIDSVFREFISRVSGNILYCADDLHAARLCRELPNSLSYGEDRNAVYRFEAIVPTNFGSRFEVWHEDRKLGEVDLGVPGKHNISNALAVAALATELGIAFPKIAEALASFRGARRRFEVKLQSDDFLVVDDYGHHPTEIRQTLKTARGIGRKRIIVMFQPHRYSRTQALRNEFGAAFDAADLVFATDIYPASEEPIAGISGETIVRAIRQRGHPPVEYVIKRGKLHREVARAARPGDLLLSLGAGDIHEEASKLVQDLEIARQLRETMGAGTVTLYEPMADHTTLRVGGPAQFWIEPQTYGGLANVLGFCSANRLPVMIVGRGSNLLVRDGGIPGVVIHLAKGDFSAVKINGLEIEAGAGVRLKQLVGAARQANIGGFEWMEGIPGSVGGSLRMNAGAMGAETFQQVVNVRVVNLRGEFEILTPGMMEVNYRNVPTLRDRFVVSAVFRGTPARFEEIEARLDAASQKRRSSQPIAASAGCIFKNPVECPAGKLVEELGLKNKVVGGARVSEIHGNFIVNEGEATAKDIIRLISEIQATAKTSRRIELQTEVQIVGVDDE